MKKERDLTEDSLELLAKIYNYLIDGEIDEFIDNIDSIIERIKKLISTNHKPDITIENILEFIEKDADEEDIETIKEKINDWSKTIFINTKTLDEDYKIEAFLKNWKRFTSEEIELMFKLYN